MRLLITGSSGFIGSALIELLRARNIEFDILRRHSSNEGSKEGVREIYWPEGISTLNLKPYSAIIHLAAAPATQSREDFLREMNVAPVRNFLYAIDSTNPACSFIFITSQSAKADTESIYGRLKWEAEKLIRAHQCKWTIIKPGLVIGPESKGLFGRLVTIVNKFPIIPLIGDGTQVIQPIGVDQITKALLKIASEPDKYARKSYSIAGDPITFKGLLLAIAEANKKKRVFLKVPTPFVKLSLSILEKLFRNPPFTKTSLFGLLSLDLIDSKEACKELGISIPPLTSYLGELLSTTRDEVEEEAKYLYQSLFGKLPSPLTVSRYIAAHQYCCFVQSPEQNIDVRYICRNRLDVESIEFATRSRKTLLSKKMSLISYLGEIEASNYEIFVNDKDKFFVGFISLGLAVLRTPWKLLKGKYLVWKYGLV